MLTDSLIENESMAANGLQPLAHDAPIWLLDTARFLPVMSQFVLSGNIQDFYLLPGSGSYVPVPLRDALWALLEIHGYEGLLIYDRFDCLQVYPSEVATINAMHLLTGLEFSEDGKHLNLPIRDLPGILKRIVFGQSKFAFLFEYGSRLAVNIQSLNDNENMLFGSAFKLSHTAKPVQGRDGKARYNPIFWVVDDVSHLPSWLVVDNDRIRQQVIQKPDYESRERAALVLTSALVGYASASKDDRKKADETFAAMTEGMTLSAMLSIVQLGRDQGVRLDDIGDAVRSYKLGIVDNPWKRGNLRNRIYECEEVISKRVKGQQQSIVKVADILKRSVMGLSGAHTSSCGASGRPRGVLFFAGPTGVGKTELAKAITELLFDDERAYIRFDMSEFSEEYSANRLIGAPPGYIGYDAGGELTKAVREKPFSVILFDEIEKAHPRILDKFLQILEDGRLTDSRGDTVYFSESIIVFTSNLGIYVPDESGRRQLNVSPEMPYEEVEHKVRRAIQDYFKFTLNRPEILNRIGDNIVVFNFIEASVASMIFDMMLANIQRRIFDMHRIHIGIPSDIRDILNNFTLSDLSNGGRGIGNKLETCFTNPLARELFKTESASERSFMVKRLWIENSVYKVELE